MDEQMQLTTHGIRQLHLNDIIFSEMSKNEKKNEVVITTKLKLLD